MLQEKYLFCLTERESQPLHLASHDPTLQEIYSVDYLDLRLFVKDSPPLKYTSLPREELVRQLLNHQETLERLMSDGRPVLPIKFGTWLQNEETMQTMLRQLYRPLRKMLDAVKGKVELDLVACYSNLHQVLEDLGKSPEIADLKEKARGKTGEELRRDQIAVGKRMKEALDKKSEEINKAVLHSVNDLVEDFRSNPLMDEAMVANAAFLLHRENQDALTARIGELDSHLSGLLKMKIVGPMPPSSFMTVAIERVDPAQIEEARKDLQLDVVTSATEIRESYRKLLRLHHPDKGGDSSERFEKLTRSYEILQQYCEQLPLNLRTEHLNKGSLWRLKDLTETGLKESLLGTRSQ